MYIALYAILNLIQILLQKSRIFYNYILDFIINLTSWCKLEKRIIQFWHHLQFIV